MSRVCKRLGLKHNRRAKKGAPTETGLSPNVYSLSSAMVWCIHVRLGLFSWKRSPASKMKSTSASLAISKISRKVLMAS